MLHMLPRRSSLTPGRRLAAAPQFPDGWNMSWSGWVGFLAPPTYQDIFMTTHIYHCFGGYDNLTPWGQVNQICRVAYPTLAGQTSTDWVTVGEYSLCMPSAPPSPFDADGTTVMRAYGEAQMQAFGSVGDATRPVKGGFFWNFKVEGGGVWSYLDGLAQGYIANLSQPLGNAALDCTAFT